MNGWRFCVTDPQDAALELCGGSMDKGDGWGLRGDGYGDGRGNGNGFGNGFRDGDGYGKGMGYGALRKGDGGNYLGGDGTSPEEWE